MSRVTSEFTIGDYTVLRLDTPITEKDYRKYKIDGVEYAIVPVYDMPGCIAVKAKGTFVGKNVSFV